MQTGVLSVADTEEYSGLPHGWASDMIVAQVGDADGDGSDMCRILQVTRCGSKRAGIGNGGSEGFAALLICPALRVTYRRVDIW